MMANLDGDTLTTLRALLQTIDTLLASAREEEGKVAWGALNTMVDIKTTTFEVAFLRKQIAEAIGSLY